MTPHLHPGLDTGPGEAAIAAAMTLKPVYDRLSALLGQAAGLLLLTTAGSGDPAAERLHLISLRAQYAEIEESLRRMAPQPFLPALLGRLLEARRLLLAGSAPRLGMGLVDLSGACCAGSH